MVAVHDTHSRRGLPAVTTVATVNARERIPHDYLVTITA